MSDAGVRLLSVTKRFASGPETITVLEGLELVVVGGESVAVTGPSGCGKTTLLNIIGGLETPDSGQVYIGEAEITGVDEADRARIRGRSVGFVFQFHYLLRDFTAVENVMLPAYMQGMPRRLSVSRALDLISRVGLSNRAHHYPHQLSGGERQRIALARALVNDPAVLLADEPTGNLDPEHSAEVEDLVFSVTENLGKNLVVVSHDDRLASRANRHLVLRDGVLHPV